MQKNSDITFKRYTKADQPAWDAFVAEAKNGLFLFLREYMDYHADRFDDCSLMAYAENRVIAVLPANRKDNTLYSHQGLTFGGWITGSDMRAVTMLMLFEVLTPWLRGQGINALVYKCIPAIYHQIPAEEDIYALFRLGAHLSQCDLTAVIDYRQRLPLSEQRVRGIKKALYEGVIIKESNDYAAFFTMLESLLHEKYDSKPTHSLSEMQLLSGLFPTNIRLFSAYKDLQMLAGVIMYVSACVVHVQYIASNDAGRECGALDALFDHLITGVFADKRYFDFGTSNGEQGQILNEGLMRQKEQFGARGVVHMQCRLEIGDV